MKKSIVTLAILMGATGLALAQPYGMGMGPGAGMGPCNPQVAPCGPGMGRGGMGPNRQGKMRWVDADGDGRISLDEHNAMAAKRFAQYDTDGDGKVTLDEFVQRSTERFKQVDANGDGFITPDERRAMRQKYRAQRGGGMGMGPDAP